MKQLYTFALAFTFLLFSFSARSQTTYTWANPATGGAWNDPNMWSPNTGFPSTGDDAVINPTAAIAITNVPASTVNSISVGGSAFAVTLSAPAAATLNIANNVTVTGGWLIVSAPLAMNFNAGSSYNHQINAGAVPTAVWSTNTNCNITGVTGTAATNLAQTFYNFLWDNAGQSGVIGFGANFPVGINGTCEIRRCGASQCNWDAPNFTWAGDLVISSNKNIVCTSASATAKTYTIRDLYITTTYGAASRLLLSNMSANANFVTLNVRNVSISGGILDYNGIQPNNSTVNVSGNFTLANAGSVKNTNALTAGTSALNFNGTTQQDVNVASGCVISGLFSSPVTRTIAITAASGSIVNFATPLICGTGSYVTFTAAAGSTLMIPDVNGITAGAGASTGSVRMPATGGSATYNVGANYTYNGTLAQITGTAFTAGNNLTINNPAGVTLSSSASVGSSASGQLILTAGNFQTASTAITLTLNGGPITGTFANFVNLPNTNLTFAGSNAALNIPSAITALRTLTVGYTNTAGLSMNGDVAVGTAFVINNGAFLNMQNYLITGAGTATNSAGGTLMTANVNGVGASGATGSIQVVGARSYTAGSSYTFNGTSAQVTGNGIPTSALNVTVNNTAGVSLSIASLTLTGTLVLQQGAFNLNGGNLVVATINGQNGGTNTGTLTGSSTSNLTTNGATALTASTTLVFTAGAQLLNNWTVTTAFGTSTTNGLGSPLTINGTLQPATNINLWTTAAGAVTIATGGTFTQLGTTAIMGAGAFTLSSGANINVAHISGLGASGATGAVQTTTRTFSGGANYTFNNTTAVQTMSTAINGTVGAGQTGPLTGNLTIANTFASSGASTSVDIIINTPGTLTINASGILTTTLNIISGTGNATMLGLATLRTSNTLGINGAIQLSGTLNLSNGASNNTNFDFTGAAAQVTGTLMPATVNNLTINNNSGGSPAVTLSQNTVANGTTTFTIGKFSIGNNAFTMNGAITITVASPIIGLANSSLTVGGAGAIGANGLIAGGGGGVFNNFTMNRSGATLSLGANTTVGGAGGTFSLTNGAVNIGTNTQTLTISGPIAFGSGSFQGSSTNASLVINGSGAITGSMTFTTTAQLANLTMNRTGVSLPLGGALDLSVFTSLNLTAGKITLGTTPNLIYTVATAIGGSPFSNANMIELNNTATGAQFIRTVLTTAATAYDFPVGANGLYGGVRLTFATNSANRNVGIRVVNTAHPSNGTPTDYFDRYWRFTDALATGTYSYTGVYNYPGTTITGTESNVKLNRWSGSIWSQDAGSSAASNVLTSGTLDQSTGSLNTQDYAGRSLVVTTYTWLTNGTTAWATATNWSPNGVPGANDNVIVNTAGGNQPVISAGAVSINNLTLTDGSLTVTGQNLTINGAFTYAAPATTNFDCTSTITYANLSSQTIWGLTYGNLTSTGSAARTLDPSSAINVCGTFTPGTSTYTVTNSTVNYTAASGTIAVPVLTVASGANYNNLQFSGAATFNVAAAMAVGGTYTQSNGTVNVGGTPTTIAGNYNQSGGTFVMNNGTVARTLTITGNAAISGGAFWVLNNASLAATTSTLNINGSTGLTVSGSGQLNLEKVSSPSIALVVIANDLTSTSTGLPVIDFGLTAVTSNEIRIGKNFSKSGNGTFTVSSTTAPVGFTFNGTAQTFSYTAGANPDILKFTVNSGSTLTMLTGIAMPTGSAPASTWTVSGTLDFGANTVSSLDANSTFTLSAAGTLVTSHASGLVGSITMTGTKTFSTTGNYTFKGTTQTAGFNFTSTIINCAKLTVTNGVFLTVPTIMNISSQLVLSGGIVELLNANMVLASGSSIVGTPSNSNMVITNGTGWLNRSVAAGAGTYQFPLGTNAAGVYEYSPATFTYTANSALTSLQVKAIKAFHPNDGSSNHIQRYWLANSASGGTYTYNASFTYVPLDIVGPEASMKLNMWNGTLWTEQTASTAASNVVSTSPAFTNVTGPLNVSPAFTARVNACAGTPNTPTAAATLSSFCSGLTTTLSVTGQSAGNGITHRWQSASAAAGPFTNIAGATNTSYTSPALTTPASVTTNVYYRLVDTCTFSSSLAISNVLTITVNPLPAVSATPATNPVCYGSNTAVTASADIPSTTFAWTPIATVSPTTGAAVTATPTVNTTYTVVGTAPSGCTGSTTAPVSVFGSPVVASPTSSNISVGNSVTLTASGGGTGVTYLWLPCTTLNVATGNSVTATPTASTTYTVTATNTTNGCSITTTATVPVTVNTGTYGTVNCGYSYTSFTPTYTSITGLSGTTAIDIQTTTYDVDDAVYTNKPINFSFDYNGVTYTSLNINSNGFVWFGSPTATPVVPGAMYTPISGGTYSMEGVLSAMGGDLITLDWLNTNILAGIRMRTAGTAPNRTCTIQWEGFLNYAAEQGYTDIFSNFYYDENRLDFQIILYEGTNKVEFVYANQSGYLIQNNFGSYQIGIRGSSNADYQNRQQPSGHWTTSSTIATGTAGASNSAVCTFGSANWINGNLGLRYTPAVQTPTVTASGSTDLCTGSTVNLTSSTAATYQWLLNGSPISGANSQALNGVSAAGNYAVKTPATGCARTSYATPVTVTAPTTPTATVTSTSPCQGSTPLFTAASTNGGCYPTYQWQLNGSNVSGATSSTYTSAALNANDQVNVIVTSNAVCASPSTATSNVIAAFATGQWLGITSTWNTATNWCGGIPGTATDVLITSGVPFQPDAIGSSATCRNLTVGTGASVILQYAPLSSNNTTFYLYGDVVLQGTGAITDVDRSTVEFDGAALQTIPTLTLHRVTMNNAGAGLLLSGDLTLLNPFAGNSSLVLTNGVINTGGYKTDVQDPSANTVSGSSATSYVNGNLKRAVAASGSYDFPVGTAANYELANVTLNGQTGVSTLTASFSTAAMTAPDPTQCFINGTPINTLLDAGYWTITPDVQPTAGTYDVSVNESGYNNLGGATASQIAVVKRDNSLQPWKGTFSSGGPNGFHNNATQTIAGSTATAKRTGLQSFSDFGIGFGNAVLPVELLSFTGVNDHDVNQLQWTTASEINSRDFELQRSPDASNFKAIATLAAAGNSVEEISYRHTDKAPFNGINYYRLKSNDLDGSFNYSNIISLFVADQLTDYVLYPNPATHQLTLEYNVVTDQTVDISVVDVLGKTWMATKHDLHSGNNVIDFGVDRLPAGVYNMHIVNEGNSEDIKFVKE